MFKLCQLSSAGSGQRGFVALRAQLNPFSEPLSAVLSSEDSGPSIRILEPRD
jgi:hypothetical protein